MRISWTVLGLLVFVLALLLAAGTIPAVLGDGSGVLQEVMAYQAPTVLGAASAPSPGGTSAVSANETVYYLTAAVTTSNPTAAAPGPLTTMKSAAGPANTIGVQPSALLNADRTMEGSMPSGVPT